MRLVFILVGLMAHAGSEEALPWPSALSCRPQALFRFTYAGVKSEEAAALCFDQTRSVLISQNCLWGACAALDQKICALPEEKVPTFKEASLCDRMGGFFQEGAFFDGAGWWDMNRCFFEKDRSFVDSGVLAARRGQCFRKGP